MKFWRNFGKSLVKFQRQRWRVPAVPRVTRQGQPDRLHRGQEVARGGTGFGLEASELYPDVPGLKLLQGEFFHQRNEFDILNLIYDYFTSYVKMNYHEVLKLWKKLKDALLNKVCVCVREREGWGWRWRVGMHPRQEYWLS